MKCMFVRRRSLIAAAVGLAVCGLLSATAYTTESGDRCIEQQQPGVVGSIAGSADFGVGILFVLRIDGSYGWQYLPLNDSAGDRPHLLVEIGRDRSVIVPAWDGDRPAVVMYFDSSRQQVIEEMDILPESFLRMISPRGVPASEVVREYRFEDVSNNADFLNALLLGRGPDPQPIGGGGQQPNEP